ncbi:MAG: MaoC/PaaZ C-terminal domain-containing protein [Deltaproteobacteria bacterium]|nr:MaoC/PaaZ C-terminal domain-containing protein [Deltaproteobacteria bacterium]
MRIYFEDLALGQTFTTPERTITQADVDLFAQLSGDHNPIHTDAEFCKHTPFGRPVAHGLLVVGVLSGLIEQTGLFEGTLIAMRRITELEFNRPVFPGDTIHGQIEAVGKTPQSHGGLVKFHGAVLNQRGETVLTANYDLLLKTTSSQPLKHA